jgi:uncharacterized membrane protein
VGKAVDKDAKVKAWLCFAALFALIVIGCVAGKYISVFSTYILNDQEKWGQFGDYFGGVLNPILSFFAFIALLITLRTQFVANDAGERRHNEQQREQRLFQLIELMNQNALSSSVFIVDVRGLVATEVVVGHRALHYACSTCAQPLGIAMREVSGKGSHYDSFLVVQKRFSQWRKSNWPSVGLYVDSVFLVLALIVQEKTNKEFARFSLNALRVQMTESERLLLWYSALFTADYAVYLPILLGAEFVNDFDGSLDDCLKPWREELVKTSLLWSHVEKEKRSAQ